MQKMFFGNLDRLRSCAENDMFIKSGSTDFICSHMPYLLGKLKSSSIPCSTGEPEPEPLTEVRAAVEKCMLSADCTQCKT